MLGNLAGWHVTIVLAVVLLIATVIVAVIVFAVVFARRGRGRSVPRGVGSESERRLRELDDLRKNDLISAAEYQAKRDEILRRL